MDVALVQTILITCVLLFKACSSQEECKGSDCGECIRFGLNCAWCSDKNYNGTRCQTYRSLQGICQEMQFPAATFQQIQSLKVSDGKGSEPPIQVSPQKVKLKVKLRDDEISPIRMTFRAANNFPVDLYFLFDNSKSMQRYINDLAALAENIGKSIGNISSNFQMGYGVFQDKVILPFTDTTPIKLVNPCVTSTRLENCSAPFEFQHLLKMTSDTILFTKKVKETNITGNLDHPEGSLDAIMQAITCKEKVGWRSASRKLLIFASNDRFHLAGDGKLAGIVIPNDGKCHLDISNKYYTKELEQDYPSVSQIREVVITNEVHIIFAVKDQKELFEKLAERVPQSVVETLAEANDTSNKNMQEIIEKKYKEMISKVEMKHNNQPGVDVQIKARSDVCEIRGTNVCKNITIGQSVEFDVFIKLTECPKKNLMVEIFPDSLSTDKMVVEIEAICSCDCETNSNTWEVNSDYCSYGNGTLKCGLCDCNKNHFGQTCECDVTDLNSGQSQCNRAGENSTRVCSGVGQCECGICKCNEGYSGQFCECNDLACGDYDNKVCGGVRGKCVCGECKCVEGYTGSTCQCSTSNDTCKSPATGEVCSNKGVCQCDACIICQKGYTGKYCENCFLCGDSVCDNIKYRQCAQCYFDKKLDTCPADCPTVEIVDSLKNYQVSTQCSIKQEDGCFISFQIIASETNETIIIQKSKTCPEPVDILPIVAGVVGGVVAIGLLLLLLWKILTSIFDRIEYSRFQEDLKQCKWAQQDNPFYKGATTTYKNPMLDTSEPIDGK